MAQFQKPWNYQFMQPSMKRESNKLKYLLFLLVELEGKW